MSKIEDYLKNKNICGVKSSNAFLVQILEEMDQIQFYYPWNLRSWVSIKGVDLSKKCLLCDRSKSV